MIEQIGSIVYASPCSGKSNLVERLKDQIPVSDTDDLLEKIAPEWFYLKLWRQKSLSAEGAALERVVYSWLGEKSFELANSTGAVVFTNVWASTFITQLEQFAPGGKFVICFHRKADDMVTLSSLRAEGNKDYEITDETANRWVSSAQKHLEARTNTMIWLGSGEFMGDFFQMEDVEGQQLILIGMPSFHSAGGLDELERFQTGEFPQVPFFFARHMWLLFLRLLSILDAGERLDVLDRKVAICDFFIEAFELLKNHDDVPLLSLNGVRERGANLVKAAKTFFHEHQSMVSLGTSWVQALQVLVENNEIEKEQSAPDYFHAAMVKVSDYIDRSYWSQENEQDVTLVDAPANDDVDKDGGSDE